MPVSKVNAAGSRENNMEHLKGRLDMNIKKLSAIALSALMIASLAACGADKTDAPKTPETPSDAVVTPSDSDADLGENTQIPNPWTDCASIGDAASAAGFDLTAPAAIAGENQSAWRVLTGDQTIFEIDFGDDITLRKAPGTGDISGDYNAYDESQDIASGDVTVTARGSDGAVHNATWEAGDYTYSLTSAAGLTPDEVAAIAAEIE